MEGAGCCAAERVACCRDFARRRGAECCREAGDGPAQGEAGARRDDDSRRIAVPSPAPIAPTPLAQITPVVQAPLIIEERTPALSVEASAPPMPPPPAVSPSASLVQVEGGPVPSLVADQVYDLRREVAGFLADVDVPGSDELPMTGRVEGPMAFLRSMLGELVEPSNRDNVTLLVLRYASYLFERAALFLVTRRAFVGLGGFSSEESSDQFVARVRKIQIPVDAESAFVKVVKFRTTIRLPLEHVPGNERLAKGMGPTWPVGETVAMPLISGDRVAAILYGDNPSGREVLPIDTLEIFLQQAGLAMERALLERRLEDSRKDRKNDDGAG